MTTALPWRPASEFQPKPNETFLVAWNDALDGDPPSWFCLVGNVRNSSSEGLVVFPFLGGDGCHTVTWDEIVWAIPVSELTPPQTEA